MQLGTEKHKAQQQMLKAKGFYSGKIDGIWGPSTIEAMVRFERSKSFAPAVPSNGMPFPERGPFPKGVILIKGLVWCPEMDSAQKEITVKSEVTQVAE